MQCRRSDFATAIYLIDSVTIAITQYLALMQCVLHVTFKALL
jgi:hypothetical protein